MTKELIDKEWKEPDHSATFRPHLHIPNASVLSIFVAVSVSERMPKVESIDPIFCSTLGNQAVSPSRKP